MRGPVCRRVHSTQWPSGSGTHHTRGLGRQAQQTASAIWRQGSRVLSQLFGEVAVGKMAAPNGVVPAIGPMEAGGGWMHSTI